jgi:hypothetical protein
LGGLIAPADDSPKGQGSENAILQDNPMHKKYPLFSSGLTLRANARLRPYAIAVGMFSSGQGSVSARDR